jgi:hypothetical protein
MWFQDDIPSQDYRLCVSQEPLQLLVWPCHGPHSAVDGHSFLRHSICVPHPSGSAVPSPPSITPSSRPEQGRAD